MKKNKIRIVICLAVGFLTVLLAVACTQIQQPAGKRQVSIIVKSTQSTFWKSVLAGAGAAATEYNVDMTFAGPESEEDYLSQNALVQDAIDRQVDAIVFSAVDYDANAEVINDAAKAGIKIIVIDSDVNSDLVYSRIGTDNYKAGQMAAEAALKSEDSALHVGIVNYDIHSANGQAREQGFRDGIADDARVTDITTINVLSTTEDARAQTTKLLKENPQINVVATFNEWTSLGVGWAIRDLEAKDHIRVVAFDNNVVSVGMLETGEVDTLIAQDPYAMGYLGVETAYHLLYGDGMPKERIDTGTAAVTRENMYREEYQKILFPFN